MESKHDKFVRLRDARLEKAIHMIELIGNLAGNAYESSPEEREKVVGDLERAVAGVSERFGVPPSVEPPGIKLDGEPDDGPRPQARPSFEETREMIRLGPRINEAIEAINDDQVVRAKVILLGIMAS